MHDPLLHIEHVARLTHTQDRDTTDSVLVEVLRSLVRPESVSLIEVVEAAGQLHCFTRAHLTADMVAPSSTPTWVSLEDCPLLSDFPERLACVQNRQTLSFQEGIATVLLVPVVTEVEATLLIEVRLAKDAHHAGAKSLADGMAQPLVEGLAKIFRNFLNLLDSSERDSSLHCSTANPSTILFSKPRARIQSRPRQGCLTTSARLSRQVNIGWG